MRKQNFDLVVTDHASPGMTGSNFVATLRSAGFELRGLLRVFAGKELVLGADLRGRIASFTPGHNSTDQGSDLIYAELVKAQHC